MTAGIGLRSATNLVAWSLLILASLVVPFLGLARFAMYFYPVLALACGWYMAQRSPVRYLQMLLTLMALTPLVRRIIDLHVGFQDANPVMLVPLLWVVGSLPTFLRTLFDGDTPAQIIAIMLGAIVYGLTLAIFDGRVIGGGIFALRWSAPLIVVCYVAAHRQQIDGIREGVVRWLICAVPALAAYGLVQFVSILPWDRYWMEMAPIDSIGSPEPFQVRVYATMSSPGHLAVVSSISILLLLPGARRGWHFVIMALAFLLLMLSLQRAAQGAAAIAILFIALMSGAELRRRIGGLSLAALLILGALTLIPEAGEVVFNRFDSIGSLKDDDSAQVRWLQYAELGSLVNSYPLGRGGGWASALSTLDGEARIVIDSGIIDALVSLGVPCGTFFLLGMGALAGSAVLRAARSRQRENIAAAGSFLFMVVQLPLGSNYVGEIAILPFLAYGLLWAGTFSVLERPSVLNGMT